jgi:hypothetical protein
LPYSFCRLEEKKLKKRMPKTQQKRSRASGFKVTTHTFLNSTFHMQVVGTKTLSPSEDDGDNTRVVMKKKHENLHCTDPQGENQKIQRSNKRRKRRKDLMSKNHQSRRSDAACCCFQHS